jgi:hypothetical protein
MTVILLEQEWNAVPYAIEPIVGMFSVAMFVNKPA